VLILFLASLFNSTLGFGITAREKASISPECI
jgi:hypothetical protein